MFRSERTISDSIEHPQQQVVHATEWLWMIPVICGIYSFEQCSKPLLIDIVIYTIKYSNTIQYMGYIVYMCLYYHILSNILGIVTIHEQEIPA